MALTSLSACAESCIVDASWVHNLRPRRGTIYTKIERIGSVAAELFLQSGFTKDLGVPKVFGRRTLFYPTDKALVRDPNTLYIIHVWSEPCTQSISFSKQPRQVVAS